MNNSVDILEITRKNLAILIGLALFMYFSYHIISGKYGYTRLTQLSPIADTKAKQLEALKDKTLQLERKVALIHPETMSPDFLEEQIRHILGYQNPDDFVILDNNYTTLSE